VTMNGGAVGSKCGRTSSDRATRSTGMHDPAARSRSARGSEVALSGCRWFLRRRPARQDKLAVGAGSNGDQPGSPGLAGLDRVRACETSHQDLELRGAVGRGRTRQPPFSSSAETVPT
jgi:hypothetical protein